MCHIIRKCIVDTVAVNHHHSLMCIIMKCQQCKALKFNLIALPSCIASVSMQKPTRNSKSDSYATDNREGSCTESGVHSKEHEKYGQQVRGTM